MNIKVTNLKKIDADLDRFAKGLGIDVVLVQKKLAFDMFADIVADTPIDTGRAMNNWNISVGTPDRSVADDVGSGSGIQASKEASAGVQLAGLKPFSTVWISNSLPYIVPLNEGSSDQAPSGFVERNIANNLSVLAVVF